jgi:COP9 signalosome complex subunit 3
VPPQRFPFFVIEFNQTNLVAPIVRRYVEIAQENAQYLPNIKLFRNLVKKLRLNSESLSVAHAPFIQFCIQSKCYSIAIPVLEDEIFEINPDNAGLSHKDVLSYFYFGALVYIGLKDYEKSFKFLKAVNPNQSNSI